RWTVPRSRAAGAVAGPSAPAARCWRCRTRMACWRSSPPGTIRPRCSRWPSSWRRGSTGSRDSEGWPGPSASGVGDQPECQFGHVARGDRGRPRDAEHGPGDGAVVQDLESVGEVGDVVRVLQPHGLQFGAEGGGDPFAVLGDGHADRVFAAGRRTGNLDRGGHVTRSGSGGLVALADDVEQGEYPPTGVGGGFGTPLPQG